MRNWLIRTQNNQLLGPISREKLIELYESDSLKEDDEVCQGDGYWFFIREKNLIQDFIYDEKKQDFNPVTEAQTVLSSQSENTVLKTLSRDDVLYPKEDDLALPGEKPDGAPEEVSVDELLESKLENTVMIQVPEKEERKEEFEGKLTDLKLQDSSRRAQARNRRKMKEKAQKAVAMKDRRLNRHDEGPKKGPDYLFYTVLIVIISMALAFIYFRPDISTLISEFSPIKNVYGQSSNLSDSQKKKSSLLIKK